MKSWKRLVAQTKGREPREFTRVRVARYCASQLPRFTGAILWLVQKITRSKFATKLAQITEAPPRGSREPGCTQRAQFGVYPQYRDGNPESVVPCWSTGLAKKAV